MVMEVDPHCNGLLATICPTLDEFLLPDRVAFLSVVLQWCSSEAPMKKLNACSAILLGIFLLVDPISSCDVVPFLESLEPVITASE